MDENVEQETSAPLSQEEEQRQERLKEMLARIAAAQASQDKVFAARNKRFEIEDMELKVLSEERAAQQAQIIADLELEHGREGRSFKVVRTQRNGIVAVSKPNHLKYGRFLDKGKHDRAHLEEIVLSNLIYPDRAKLNKIIEDEYDTLRKCSNALAELHGMNLKEELPGK